MGLMLIGSMMILGSMQFVYCIILYPDIEDMSFVKISLPFIRKRKQRLEK